MTLPTCFDNISSAYINFILWYFHNHSYKMKYTHQVGFAELPLKNDFLILRYSIVGADNFGTERNDLRFNMNLYSFQYNLLRSILPANGF